MDGLARRLWHRTQHQQDKDRSVVWRVTSPQDIASKKRTGGLRVGAIQAPTVLFSDTASRLPKKDFKGRRYTNVEKTLYMSAAGLVIGTSLLSACSPVPPEATLQPIMPTPKAETPTPKPTDKPTPTPTDVSSTSTATPTETPTEKPPTPKPPTKEPTIVPTQQAPTEVAPTLAPAPTSTTEPPPPPAGGYNWHKEGNQWICEKCPYNPSLITSDRQIILKAGDRSTGVLTYNGTNLTPEQYFTKVEELKNEGYQPYGMNMYQEEGRGDPSVILNPQAIVVSWLK